MPAYDSGSGFNTGFTYDGGPPSLFTPKKTGSDLVRYLTSLYNAARNYRRSRLPTWVRNFQMVNNKFGTTTVAEPWIPNPRSSEVYPIGSTFVAWLSDQNPEISFSAAADPSAKKTFDELQDIAGDLTTVYNSTWSALNFAYQMKLGYWDVFTYGIACYKTSWDEGLDGGLGNVTLNRIHPWSIYVDPRATTFDDANHIVEVRRMHTSEIERRWPGHTSTLNARGNIGEMDEPPKNDSSGGPAVPPSNIVPPYGGNNSSIGPSQLGQRGRLGSGGELTVYEFWIKENDEWWEDGEAAEDGTVTSTKRIRARWRVVVLCQQEILMDEYADELWAHGSHPYTRFVYDDIGEFYGIALCDHLAAPQVYINRLLSAIQLNTELTGNPVLIEPQDSLSTRVNWTNKPGQRIPSKSGGDKGPTWLTPPSMPSSVMDLINWWRSSMETISGLSAAMRGNTPTARVAQGVQSAANESTFVRIRSGLQNLEIAMQEIATKHADIMIDNYTTERFVAIVGPSGEQTSIKLRPRHFNTQSQGLPPMKYAIHVDAGSQLPTSLAGKIAREMQLFSMHVTDDEALLAALRYPHFREVLERKYMKQQQGLLGGSGAAGKTRNAPSQYGGSGGNAVGRGQGSGGGG